MKEDKKIELIRFRFIIGYLGENTQPTWWNSSFFASASKMFLSPIFPKTSLLAQYHGIKEAATRIHDERIGVGKGVFHLFRLPDALEQNLHQLVINNKEIERFVTTLTNQAEVLAGLASLMDKKEIKATVGPIRIGHRSDLEKPDTLGKLARCYYQAFETNVQVFPYFSEGK